METPIEKVRVLAAQGMSEHRIAEALRISVSTLQTRKRKDSSWREAYRTGLLIARENRRRERETRKRVSKKIPLFDADEYVPPRRMADVLVEKAARDGARRYREFCLATGLDARTVVKTLERLQLHSVMTKIEGLMFDEWVIL